MALESIKKAAIALKAAKTTTVAVKKLMENVLLFVDAKSALMVKLIYPENKFNLSINRVLEKKIKSSLIIRKKKKWKKSKILCTKRTKSRKKINLFLSP